MEKGKIKNNLLKILTMGIVSATLLTSTACATETNENNIIDKGRVCHHIIAEDAFIVLDDIDGKVLHKGDVEQSYVEFYSSSVNLIAELRFDCGESVATPSDYKIYKDKETAKKHSTKVCEECFGLN